jgi:hypothetical protein
MADEKRRRRAEVLGVTITELTIILLFVMFVYSQEGDRELQFVNDKIHKIMHENSELNNAIQNLKKEKQEYEVKLVKLKLDIVVLQKNIVDRLNIKIDEITTNDIEKNNKIINQRLKPPAGKYNCLASKGYLLSIVMKDSGFRISRFETPDRGKLIDSLDLVINTHGKDLLLSTKDAKRNFWKLFELSRENNCRFFIKLYDETSRKDTFVSQLDLVDSYFYKKKMW